MFDVLKLLKDYRIQYRQDSSGWLNICCPFRLNHKGGDTKYFGGFDLRTGGYNCWSCQGVSNHKVIAELLNISNGEAFGLLQGYGGGVYMQYHKEKRQNATIMQMPGAQEPRPQHTKYIEGRGYDFKHLTEKYMLHFTHGGDEPKWRQRVIIPITYGHRVVAYQGRDVIDRGPKDRWMSATPEESLMHYKDVIYGIDDWHSKTVGVVEGAFDVFRMGKGICTGFGSALTDSQVTKLAERFNRVVFLFDPGDELAWAKAGKHMLELKSMGVNAERVRWASKLDPDELGFKECRILKHQCGIK
jgi:hypothetical protein